MLIVVQEHQPPLLMLIVISKRHKILYANQSKRQEYMIMHIQFKTNILIILLKKLHLITKIMKSKTKSKLTSQAQKRNKLCFRMINNKIAKIKNNQMDNKSRKKTLSKNQKLMGKLLRIKKRLNKRVNRWKRAIINSNRKWKQILTVIKTKNKFKKIKKKCLNLAKNIRKMAMHQK